MKFRPVLRKNPRKINEPGKYYPNPVYEEKVQFRQIAKEISERTSFGVPDSIAFLEALTEILPDFLTMGKIVQLGEFGTFRITFEGQGSEKKKDVIVSSIRSFRLNFLPRPELINRINETELKKEKEK